MTTADVLVLGGGPAGLQAALTLGRVHRDVVLLDSGTYRNDAATHLHNLAAHDGTPPAQWRAAARADLAGYPVEVRSVAADAVRRDGERFVAEPAGGGEIAARALVLATGLRDEPPDVPGMRELWGSVVAHCPFCHGHEMSGRPVAMHGSGPQLVHLAMLLHPIASRLVVLTDGGTLDEQVAAGLAGAGVAVRSERVVRLEADGDGACAVLDGGAPEHVGGVFVAPTSRQAAPFAEQLGLRMLPSGCVEVDDWGRTSEPGVYAAGDMAHRAVFAMPMASVLAAAAAGQLAGSAAVAGLG